MSLLEGLAAILRDMTLGELTLALAAILAYSLAINGSFGGTLRTGAASVAFAAAVGFTTLSSGWMSATVFLALAVVGIAAFAALAWALSSLLGFSAGRVEPVFAGDEAIDATPVATAALLSLPSFGRQTSAMPL